MASLATSLIATAALISGLAVESLQRQPVAGSVSSRCRRKPFRHTASAWLTVATPSTTTDSEIPLKKFLYEFV
ncbi:hypothetical protein KFK09_011264 [Dendrobium nobile]|uniref:Uncharacterized protein n=1 Tax=Dendrobium nobile TaxID=94219 RepID=A0A8T3BCE0_DENNO|nr:hypothetical protein KFK09_011264 [Dendrobium nobile]